MFKKFLLGVATLVLMAGVTFAADPVIKVPTDLKVQAGRQLIIKADTTCKTIKWVVLTDAVVDLTVFPDGREAVFTAPVGGTYKILLYTASGDVPSEPAFVTISVEGGPDPGPGPGPGPGPNPPPPNPDAVFQANLNKAFADDTGADKATKLQTLITIYKRGATTTAFDADVKTVGDLLKIMHTTTQQLVGNDLSPLRDVIGNELNAKLPRGANTALDDANRKLISAQFQRVADLLGKVPPPATKGK